MRHLLIVLLLAVFGGGCTLLGLGQKRQKTTQERTQAAEAAAAKEPQDNRDTLRFDDDDVDGDDEAGVNSIVKSLRGFRKALHAKDFERAEQFLRRAQKRVRSATPRTRSHPEFEEVEEATIRARASLEVAIEKDRIERRNAAIDDIIARGETLTAKANILYVELAQRPPTRQDVEYLDQLIRQLDALRAEGADYLDETRYTTHADDRDQKTQVLVDLRRQAQWLVNATDAVNNKIEEAYDAAVEVRESPSAVARIEGFHKSSIGFKACATTIGELEGEVLYDPKKVLKTRLGDLTIVDTKKRCLDLAAQARAQVASLTWKRSVEEVVSHLNTALARLRAPKDAEDELQKAREAANALASCATKLERVDKQEGFENQATFKTLLGEMSAVVLVNACIKERERIVNQLPTIEWRTTLGGIRTRLADTKGVIQRAKDSRSALEAVPLWEQAVGGLKECEAQARVLSRKKGASKTIPIATAYGELTIDAIEKTCTSERVEAEKALTSAISRREVEDFAGTVRGDEKDVVSREGIPSRIESFAGGRVFIYEKKGPKGTKELRRYGFDGGGKRVDYWVEWRNQMVTLVSELTRVLTAVRSAPNAAGTLAAIQEAEPVLNVCGEVLNTGKQSPGYDAKAVFRTPLGRLSADSLIDACLKEKNALLAQVTNLQWRERVERLRDRINESRAQLTQAAQEPRPDDRLRILSSALGGLDECIDRADALPKEQGAEPKFKVESVLGKLDIQGIRKACVKLQSEVRAAADQALADRAVEKFIKKCRADEIEVARREGVPKQIVRIGPGRVFVYAVHDGKKSTTKRIAFDHQGKRINEDLLTTQANSQPEVFDLKDGEVMPVPELVPPK